MTGVSPRQLMAESPASDLAVWQHLQELQWTEYRKEDYYFAQLAWVQAAAAGVKGLKLDDFLIKFGEDNKREMSQYEGMQHSIACWEMATGKKAK